MKKKIVSLALCLALCLSLLPMAATNASAEEPVTISYEEWDAIAATNRERVDNGLSPLTTTVALQSACEVRADELLELISHTRPDGTACYTALDDAGISSITCGENIAAGYYPAESVVNGWMNSPGHRANILNAEFVHMGIGYVYAQDASYWHYWTQVFYSGWDCSYSQMLIAEMSTDTYEVGSSIEDLYLCAELYCDSCECWCFMPVLSDFCTGYNSQSTGSQTVTVSCLGQTATIRLRLGGGEVSPEVTDNNDGAVYRVYNPITGEHLLCTAAAEVNSLTGVGWSLDGIMCYMPTSGTPIYRLYNPTSGEHLYTMVTSEIENLTAVGWNVDGIIAYSADSSGLPIYRLYNASAPAISSHLLSTSQSEMNTLTAQGWKIEGVAMYAVS